MNLKVSKNSPSPVSLTKLSLLALPCSIGSGETMISQNIWLKEPVENKLQFVSWAGEPSVAIQMFWMRVSTVLYLEQWLSTLDNPDVLRQMFPDAHYPICWLMFLAVGLRTPRLPKAEDHWTTVPKVNHPCYKWWACDKWKHSVLISWGEKNLESKFFESTESESDSWIFLSL